MLYFPAILGSAKIWAFIIFIVESLCFPLSSPFLTPYQMWGSAEKKRTTCHRRCRTKSPRKKERSIIHFVIINYLVCEAFCGCASMKARKKSDIINENSGVSGWSREVARYCRYISNPTFFYREGVNYWEAQMDEVELFMSRASVKVQSIKGAFLFLLSFHLSAVPGLAIFHLVFASPNKSKWIIMCSALVLFRKKLVLRLANIHGNLSRCINFTSHAIRTVASSTTQPSTATEREGKSLNDGKYFSLALGAIKSRCQRWLAGKWLWSQLPETSLLTHRQLPLRCFAAHASKPKTVPSISLSTVTW